MNEGTIQIAVGSEKPFKVDFARDYFFNEFNEAPISSEGIEVDSGVSEQPLDREEAAKGAQNRSLAVLDRSKATLV